MRNSSIPRALSSPLKNSIVFSSGFHCSCGHRASKASRLKGLANNGIADVSGMPAACIPAAEDSSDASAVATGGSATGVAKLGWAGPPCDAARSCSALFNAS